MTTVQWFVHVAILTLWAFGASSASAEGAYVRAVTGTETGNVLNLFPSFRAVGDLQPSTVTVTAAQRTVTVIKTIVQTTVETTVINAATATTAILTVPLTVNGLALTSTVYFQNACSVRELIQEAPLRQDETSGEAVNTGQNPTVSASSFDNISSQKVDSNPVNVLDKVFDPSKFKTKNATVPLAARPEQNQDGGAVFEKVVHIYPTTKFTSVMAALSQLVSEMKMTGSRTDLVKRYEEVSVKDAMYRIGRPETRRQELEEMAGELLEEAQKRGHESDEFFERLEKFVGFMETIYVK